jgi:hypothetical protein
MVLGFHRLHAEERWAIERTCDVRLNARWSASPELARLVSDPADARDSHMCVTNNIRRDAARPIDCDPYLHVTWDRP